MADEYIERIQIEQQTGDVEDVAGRTAVFAGRRDGDASMGNGLEQVPLIEQSHVNAPKVGRMSHQIAVSGFAKGRIAGQVANDRIVSTSHKATRAGASHWPTAVMTRAMSFSFFRYFV